MPYETITIPNVELFSTGRHNDDVYNLADLEEMVKNSRLISTKPIIKIGHGDKQEVEGPSLGFVDSLRIVGNKLVGDLVNVPKKLGELIKSGAYGQNRSAEIYWDFQDSAGRVLGKVFRAIALLGESWPAVLDLNPIDLAGVQSLYTLTAGVCYDEQGRYFRRYTIPLSLKRGEYSIKQVAKEFHVMTASGLTLGKHSEPSGAERQRKALQDGE